MRSKRLTAATIVGALATTSFAGQLMAGTAISPGFLRPAFVRDAGPGNGDRFRLYSVHDEKKKKKYYGEGGEGGEGAEGGLIIYPPARATVPMPHPTRRVACDSHRPAGIILGGVTGAAVGYQFGDGKGQHVATALGALMGMFIGNAVGAQLDATDAACAEAAASNALAEPIGTTINWNNPDTGAAGSVRSTREGSNAQNGQYCREFVQTVTVGGQLQEAYGIACRQPDGNWQIVG